MRMKLRDIVPYKIMKERRIKQHFQILKAQQEPLVYNSKGQRKRVFYLKDILAQHTPYTLVLGQEPEEILWDRNNTGLPIQFFSHTAIFDETSPYCVRKYALLFESETIQPEDYTRVMNDPGRMAEYSKIFTFSDQVLDRYQNALFIPASGLWYGTAVNGGTLDERRYGKKEKNISVVASAKAHTKYHRLRVETAKRAVEAGLADGYGAFCNNRINQKADALDDYRYSIVVENDVKPYYFTEKILDCFASMTIPIYLGAAKIGEYFNTDGIIMLEEGNCDHIETVLKQCSAQDYEARLEAVKDNFERVKQFRCIEDYLMMHYRDEFTLDHTENI